MISFYEGKIPPLDLNLLKIAIFIQKKHDDGDHGEGDRLKLEAMQIYSNRAKNICNLYSAGYFHDFLKSAYLSLSALPDFTAEMFNEIYDLVVGESILAVFINRTMDINDVTEKILKKIEQNKQFGIRTFKIHGINKDNCIKIKTALLKIEGTEQITYDINQIASEIISVRVTILSIPAESPKDSSS